MVSDFAVVSSILFMVLFDFIVGLDTPKLLVPPEFRVGSHIINLKLSTIVVYKISRWICFSCIMIISAFYVLLQLARMAPFNWRERCVLVRRGVGKKLSRSYISNIP